MSIVAIQFPMFQPAMRVVTNITNSFPAIVTTSFAHQYLTGTIVRLYIPPFFGMQQINELSGEITVLSPTTFSIPIDTTNFDPYSVPPSLPGQLPIGTQQTQYPQVVPFGENNGMFTAATQNVLPYP